MVKFKDYVPDTCDIVWLNFNPQTGREQSGSRPAVVISPKIYNEKSKSAIFLPITNQEKGYPFEIKIPSGLKVQGVILSDQIKSLDWNHREAQFACKLPKDILKKALNKLTVLLNQ